MKKSLSIFLPMLVLLSACKKNITDYNANGKGAINVPAITVFLNGQKNLSDTYTTPAAGTAPFREFAQSWTATTYTTEARYILTAYNSPNGWWNNMYTSVLNNLENAKSIFPSNVTDPAILKNDLIITDILEVYAYNLLVSTYGNIPYSQAENRTIPFPKYDDAKTVYMDLLNRLDTCITGLNTGAIAMGAVDQLYQGSPAAWKKFAATLKLKMAMVLSDVDAATASKKAQEAIATGVFTSNADNAVFKYQATPTGNANPIWQALINSGRHDFVPAELIVNTMNAWNDPRLPLYYDTVKDGTYKGGLAGGGNSYGDVSQFDSATWQAPTFGDDMLDYSETEFLLAEAVERGFPVGGTAEMHYNNAVTASITSWGGSTTDAMTYLAQPTVAYTSAAGTYKQKIGYQQWIAFANRGWDAWTSIRRLGYPNVNDPAYKPVGAQGLLPLRYYYPLTEQSANSNNWADAVKAMSGGVSDNVATKLFWMP